MHRGLAGRRLRHWHPVLKSSELRRKPRKVTLCGIDFALFRTADGVVGVVPDTCVHRRASLSRGQVGGKRRRCPYHGWEYETGQLDRVTVDVRSDDHTVSVVSGGPQKPLPSIIERAFGIETGDTFIDEWVTHFSPVYAVYDHWWESPAGTRRPSQRRTAVFFNPVSDVKTELWSIAVAKSHRPAWLDRLLRPMARALVEVEVRRDKSLIDGLADKSTSMSGMKLSRFDKPLGENRRRIKARYDAENSQ